MGHGIAQIAATAGYEIILRDIKDEFLKEGLDKIKYRLNRNVEKNRMTREEADEAFSRIKGTTDLNEACRDPDLIIEAVPEDMEFKKGVYREIDPLCPEKTIFASNTSALSITEMASVTKRQDKFIGMHFFNPPQIMRLVEVIRGVETSDETTEIIKDLAKKFGKTPVEVNDFPGFVVNRIAFPMINEAIFALQNGVATKEGIDNAIKLGLNHPMGPLELADMIGLDVLLATVLTLYEEYRDSKYRPAPLLIKMVRAGHLGRKTGRGFYEYY